ncbi:MAG: LysR family transcriptional regulator [Alphaproteobacteria bacterium]|nr:LysR family transcriptional regulator [Alphaproteobacteria bacterium]
MASRKLPPLNALRTFEAVARHMSFTKAGQELSVTQGAVSQQIKLLEDYLGVRLFSRSKRELDLTPEGREYVAPLQEALTEIELATKHVTKDVDRVLTINVIPSVAVQWFFPRVPGFIKRHPATDIRLTISHDPLDPTRDDFDAAIRLGMRARARQRAGLPDNPRAYVEIIDAMKGLKAELLCPYVVVPVCSPALLSGAHPLHTLDDLRHHTLLHSMIRPYMWLEYFRVAGAGHEVVSKHNLHYSHFFLIVQAAEAGMGVALMPEFLVADKLAAGSLVSPFPTRIETGEGYYLITRRQQGHLAKVRAFRKWLLEVTTAERRPPPPNRQPVAAASGRPAPPVPNSPAPEPTGTKPGAAPSRAAVRRGGRGDTQRRAASRA